MKILQLLSSGGYYGKEAVVVNLSSALAKMGYTTDVGVLLNHTSPNDGVVVEARRQGLQARVFDCRGRVDFQTVGTIADYLDAKNIDLVHTHDYKADLYGHLAARRRRHSLFGTCHLWFPTTRSEKIYGAIDRLVLRRFDGVIAVSSQIADILVKSQVLQSKVQVIPNGIDFSPYLSVEKTCPHREFGPDITIGIVGRLTQQKGHSFLFKAARGILQKFARARFVVIGDGPDRAQLEALTRDLKIDGSVQFVGFRDDMPRVYAGLDMIVMPSLDEGLPMTLLEAMAAERAVVASAVGAVPEVIKHGESGLLVQPGSSLELEQAVLQFLDDVPFRRRVAENARRSVAKFSSELMARRYLDFYERMGKGPGVSS